VISLDATFLDRVRESRWLKPGLQAAAALAVVGLLVAIGWGWYSWRESRALAALSDATALTQQADKLDAAPGARDRAVRALELVIADYPRLAVVPQAAYQLGNLKYSSGKYQEARSAYELAIAKGASGALRTLSSMGIAYTWEAEKKYAMAAQALESAAKELRPKDFLYEETLMTRARDEELAGKPAVAIELYQRIIRDSPNTRQAEEARNRMASLRSRTGQ
jgi:tetratricopeptide (TPR) repeat protein